MSDRDTLELDVFNAEYAINEDGNIKPRHTMGTSQAEQLAVYYDDCPSLQEAVRAACRDAIRQRQETLTVQDFYEQRRDVEELSELNNEILATLEEIRDTLDK